MGAKRVSIETGCGLDGVRDPARARDLSVLLNVCTSTALGLNQSPIQWVPWAISHL